MSNIKVIKVILYMCKNSQVIQNISFFLFKKCPTDIVFWHLTLKCTCWLSAVTMDFGIYPTHLSYIQVKWLFQRGRRGLRDVYPYPNGKRGRVQFTSPSSIFQAGLSHFKSLRYLLSSLFSRVVLPTQADNILPALGEPSMKRERTTNNTKS